MNKNDIINAIIYAYGYSHKDAEKAYKNYSDERKKLLVDGWKNDAKKSFYND